MNAWQRMVLGLVPVVMLVLACSGSVSVPPAGVGEDTYPPVCGKVFPRDCMNADKQCWPPYGCLTVSLSREQCAWIHNDSETASEDEIVLTVPSGRVTTIDETMSNPKVGIRTIGPMRYVEFMIGTTTFRKLFGNSTTEGYADKGYADFGEMTEVANLVASGTVKHLLFTQNCPFTVFGPNFSQSFQAYYKVKLKKLDLRNFLKAAIAKTEEVMKDQEQEGIRVDIREKTREFHEVLRKAEMEKLAAPVN